MNEVNSLLFIQPIPQNNRGKDGGKQTHEDYSGIDFVRDQALVEADEADDHRHLSSGRHAKAHNRRVFKRQALRPGRQKTPNNFRKNGDNGKHDKKTDHLGRYNMNINKNTE